MNPPEISDYDDDGQEEEEEEEEEDNGDQQESQDEQEEEGEEDESGEIASSDEDIFAELHASAGTDNKAGPPIAISLADYVTDMVKTRATEERQKEIFEDYKAPSNVSLITNPKLNSELQSKLSRNSQRTDYQLSHTGDKIVQALTINTLMAERLGKLKDKVLGDTRKEIKQLIQISTDAIQANAIALQENNQRRRENIRRDINPTFKELCDRPQEESEWLFGHDLSEKVKECNQNKGLGQQLGLEKKKEPRQSFLVSGRFSLYGSRYR